MPACGDEGDQKVEDKTGQDKTRQDKIRQDRTRQDTNAAARLAEKTPETRTGFGLFLFRHILRRCIFRLAYTDNTFKHSRCRRPERTPRSGCAHASRRCGRSRPPRRCETFSPAQTEVYVCWMYTMPTTKRTTTLIVRRSEIHETKTMGRGNKGIRSEMVRALVQQLLPYNWWTQPDHRRGKYNCNEQSIHYLNSDTS